MSDIKRKYWITTAWVSFFWGFMLWGLTGCNKSTLSEDTGKFISEKMDTFYTQTNPVSTATSTPKNSSVKGSLSAPITTTQVVTTINQTNDVVPTAVIIPTTPQATVMFQPSVAPVEKKYEAVLYEGTLYHVQMGRNGNPYLIQDYSTLPEILQAYAYPTLDIEAIRKDVTLYAMTQGFTRFGLPSGMTEQLANTECSWESPGEFSYLGDSSYDEEFTELDDVIGMREYFRDEIEYLAKILTKAGDKDMGLCIWFPYGCDSTYRMEFRDNGLYNGEVTKEYVIYFMHGWGNGVEAYVL